VSASGDRAPSRPSGTPPPVEAPFGGGRLRLPPLAGEVAARHLAAHPEDAARYGEDLAHEWAVHDMQHVLSWAFGEEAGFVVLDQQVGWLARVLDARGYPLANLADCLRTAADVVEERVDGAGAVAERLRAVGDGIRPA
jgi:hypothetical protein